MLDADLLSLSAAEQARLIAAGDIDACTLRASESAARSRLAPSLNAFIDPDIDPIGPVVAPDIHPDSASPANDALLGVSVAVKDNIDVAGLPTGCGLAALDAQRAERDAGVVARLRAAGVVPWGKTNMAAMALGASTHNADLGDCFNPLRAGYSAGGSSGGSASAVAAGLCGIALGTDTMGSVRIPAAFCGIVGFKPSWGALSVDGVTPLSRQLDHVGVLGRTLEDVTLAYRLMCDDAVACTGGIGCELAMPAALTLDDDVQRDFDRARDALLASGFRLHSVDLGNVDLSRMRRAGLLLCEAELLNLLHGVYPERRDRLPADLVGLLDFAAGRSAADLARSVSLLAAARDALRRHCAAADALLLPTSPHTAFPMTGPVPADTADLTAIGNVLGAPAISLPLPALAGELPSGLQLIGHCGQDEALLSLAERVRSVLG